MVRLSWLTSFDDTVAQISVSLETDQVRDSPIFALARWSRSQSTGLTYLSISA